MIRIVHLGFGSRIWILIFTDPGSKGQKGTRFRIRIRNTEHIKSLSRYRYLSSLLPTKTYLTLEGKADELWLFTLLAASWDFCMSSAFSAAAFGFRFR
jgi:hypothetical protein